jgi:hypothetical protein
LLTAHRKKRGEIKIKATQGIIQKDMIHPQFLEKCIVNGAALLARAEGMGLGQSHPLGAGKQRRSIHRQLMMLAKSGMHHIDPLGRRRKSKRNPTDS